jgi:hypothetical protein
MNHEHCGKKWPRLFFMIGLVPTNASSMIDPTKKHLRILTIRQLDVSYCGSYDLSSLQAL